MGLISKQQAAKRLGKEVRTIDDWIECGILKACKIQRKPNAKPTSMIDEAQVNSLLASARDIRKSKEILQHEQAHLNAELDDVRKASGIDRWAVNKLVETALVTVGATLTSREADIVKNICAGRYYEDVAKDLGLTRERTRQLFEKAFRRMRVSLSQYNDAIEKYNDVVLERDALQMEVVRLRKHMEKNEPTEIEKYREKLLAMSLREHFSRDLSVRALNCLMSAGIETLGQLTMMRRTDLLKLKNFGRKSISDLDELLAKLDLTWRTA